MICTCFGPGLGSMSPDNASSRKREMAIAQDLLFQLCIWPTLELVVEPRVRVYRLWRNRPCSYACSPLTDIDHVPRLSEFVAAYKISQVDSQQRKISNDATQVLVSEFI